MFYLICSTFKPKIALLIIIFKVVDEIPLCEHAIIVEDVVIKLRHRFAHETVAYGAGQLHLFVFIIVTYDDSTVSIDGDDKSNRIKTGRISRVWRSNVAAFLPLAKQKLFVLVNSSINCLKVAAYFFLTQVSNLFQRTVSKATISMLSRESACLCKFHLSITYTICCRLDDFFD